MSARILVNVTENIIRLDDLGPSFQIAPWRAKDLLNAQHFTLAVLDLTPEGSRERRRLDGLKMNGTLREVDPIALNTMHQHYAMVVRQGTAEPLSPLPPHRCGRVTADWLCQKFPEFKPLLPAKAAKGTTNTPVVVKGSQAAVAPVSVPESTVSPDPVTAQEGKAAASDVADTRTRVAASFNRPKRPTGG